MENTQWDLRSPFYFLGKKKKWDNLNLRGGEGRRKLPISPTQGGERKPSRKKKGEESLPSKYLCPLGGRKKGSYKKKRGTGDPIKEKRGEKNLKKGGWGGKNSSLKRKSA